MIFGDQVQVAETTDSAAWIDAARQGTWGTLGALVPNHYESYLRVRGAASAIVDWWEAQRAVIAAIAQVAARHTTTPERAWFGIWKATASTALNTGRHLEGYRSCTYRTAPTTCCEAT